MARTLVIDDNDALRALVRTVLERDGHEVLEAADGRAGVRAFYAERPDVVVLDVSMPQMDGWGALARIRELSDVPVLVVSADAGQRVCVRALTGGDDFLAKPFGTAELRARVTALLRRSARSRAGTVVEDGWARVDHRRHEAVVEGVALRLTPLEFRLLGTFLLHQGAALTHDQLLEHVWADDQGSREQVKVVVLSLRRKLRAAAPTAAEPIETVRGVGYRWRGAAVPVA